MNFHHVLSHLESLSTGAKLAFIGTAGILATAADAFSKPNTWEDWSLKGILLVTVIFLVRFILQSQKEHKLELKEERAQHNAQYMARDSAMVEALSKNTKAVEDMASLTREQTGYFQAVTRDIVNERMSRKPDPKLP